jgi:AcrR family transcriptional regulator
MPPSRRSTLREQKAEVTRRAILEAARGLFARKGYTGTSIAAVAREAGVSVQTLYDSVGGKSELLSAMQAAIDDAGKVGTLNQQMAASVDPREVLRLLARLKRGMMEGAGDIFATLIAAKDTSREVSRLWDAGQRRTRAGSERTAEQLASLGVLRLGIGPAEAADILYGMLSPSLYLRLLHECSWSHDRIEEWLADSLARLLL